MAKGGDDEMKKTARLEYTWSHQRYWRSIAEVLNFRIMYMTYYLVCKV